MKAILGNIETFASGGHDLMALSVDQIRSDEGHKVQHYSELISKLAQLAFVNPDFVLLMRGQSRDYMENGKTTLFPTMYRTPTHSDDFYAMELRLRYERLRNCERHLYEALRYTAYWDRVGRSELARWAILQHYEVCPTPLMDLTHSALVACSFAFLGGAKSGVNHYYLYVIGVHQINGAITVAANHALQVVRLSGVCPPETLRPYFQEGYLIGTYPSVDTLDEKMRSARSEMDCAQRLIAKFKVSTASSFWDQGFINLPSSALYPDESGQICSKLSELKQKTQ